MILYIKTNDEAKLITGKFAALEMLILGMKKVSFLKINF